MDTSLHLGDPNGLLTGGFIATSSVRFYCTTKEDNQNNHDNYLDDPWTKFRETNASLLQASTLFHIPAPRVNEPVQESSQSETSGVSEQVQLTHVDHQGQARMVDVSDKAWTTRRARAQATVWIGPEAFRLVAENQIKKGDVLKVAEIAGISGGKLTSQLIPLCHPIALHQLRVHLSLDSINHCVKVESEAVTRGPTGVEMEALTATSVACLTIIDMVKAVTKEAEILNLQLVSKSGGTRGDFKRKKNDDVPFPC